MNPERRTFLSMLAGLPLLGWLKPNKLPPRPRATPRVRRIGSITRRFHPSRVSPEATVPGTDVVEVTRLYRIRQDDSEAFRQLADASLVRGETWWRDDEL
jgi:hypothetical protein